MVPSVFSESSVVQKRFPGLARKQFLDRINKMHKIQGMRVAETRLEIILSAAHPL